MDDQDLLALARWIDDVVGRLLAAGCDPPVSRPGMPPASSPPPEPTATPPEPRQRSVSEAG